MSEEKDDLKSIKVYKFNNTKENWHEFALKFRVIADYRDYWGIIDGSVVPPDELAIITVTAEDTGEALKEKKEKLKARKANKMGYRDLVMSTVGISLNIVENAVSEELTKGDLKKAWERLEKRWNPRTREDKVEVYTKFLNYKLENTRQRPMDWITFMEKKRAELMNTGHIMNDETFITHLLNSLPQTEYEEAILVVKDKLRKGPVDIPEIEQVLEDKYQAIKHAKGWEEEEDDYALFAMVDELKTIRDESTTKKDNVESAMMCWESAESLAEEELREEPEKVANKLVETTEKQKHEEEHVEPTLNTGNQLKISIEEFSWEREGDGSTLGTEEPEQQEIVYITNLKDGLRKDGTTLYNEEGPNEKKPAARSRPIEVPSLNNPNHVFDTYGESGSDVKHIEDFSKGEDKKNSKEYDYTNTDVKKEGKQADIQEMKITRYHHDILKKGENEKALVTKEMGLGYLEKNIFIGDSAATSHMTSR